MNLNAFVSVCWWCGWRGLLMMFHCLSLAVCFLWGCNLIEAMGRGGFFEVVTLAEKGKKLSTPSCARSNLIQANFPPKSFNDFEFSYFFLTSARFSRGIHMQIMCNDVISLPSRRLNRARKRDRNQKAYFVQSHGKFFSLNMFSPRISTTFKAFYTAIIGSDIEAFFTSENPLHKSRAWQCIWERDHIQNSIPASDHVTRCRRRTKVSS